MLLLLLCAVDAVSFGLIVFESKARLGMKDASTRGERRWRERTVYSGPRCTGRHSGAAYQQPTSPCLFQPHPAHTSAATLSSPPRNCLTHPTPARLSSRELTQLSLPFFLDKKQWRQETREKDGGSADIGFSGRLRALLYNIAPA